MHQSALYPHDVYQVLHSEGICNIVIERIQRWNHKKIVELKNVLVMYYVSVLSVYSTMIFGIQRDKIESIWSGIIHWRESRSKTWKFRKANKVQVRKVICSQHEAFHCCYGCVSKLKRRFSHWAWVSVCVNGRPFVCFHFPLFTPPPQVAQKGVAAAHTLLPT